MHIITLTSDWKEHDFYVASLKGKLLSACPEVQIIDINHRIKPFNTSHAAFILRNAYPHFPDNSVHIIAVNTEANKGKHMLAARKEGQYFICADNGILGLLGGNEPDELVSLTTGKQDTFVTLSVFAAAASDLCKGKALSELGAPVKEYDRQTPLRATIEDRLITGSVIHIDSHQNAISNISRELFDRVGKGRAFQIFVQSKHYVLDRINEHYNDSEPGDLLAIFNSLDLLEIAIRDGNAAGLQKLNTNSIIRIEFKEG